MKTLGAGGVHAYEVLATRLLPDRMLKVLDTEKAQIRFNASVEFVQHEFRSETGHVKF